MVAALPKAEQYEKTRTALLTVAYELFAERGYADVSTKDIVERAELTRGALYYHFRNKKSLFCVVFEQVRQARTQAVQTRIRAAEGDLWQRIVETGCTAFLDSLLDEHAQRIIFTDGPSVLDPDIWHNDEPGVNLIRHSLEQLAAEGFIEEAPYDALARLLLGVFLEVGIYITHATDRVKARREMLQGLEHLFNSLRINKPHS